MNLRFLLPFLFVTLLFSCKPDVTREVVTNKVVTPMPESFRLDGMQGEEYRRIADSVDHIDYIFYDLPLSINQDGKPNVLRDLSYLSTTAVEGIPEGCKPMARKIYLGQGNIITEADLFFMDGCYLQIFYKEQEPIYGNLLTAQGAQYYGNMMIQIGEEREKEVDRQLTEKGFLPAGN